MARETIKHDVAQSRINNDAAFSQSLMLARESEEQFKNRQAENIAVRKKLWGVDTVNEPESTANGDEMKHVLGDNTETVTHNYPQPRPSTLATLGKAALIALGFGVPATVGAIMLPSIIDAVKPNVDMSQEDTTTETNKEPTVIIPGEDLENQYKVDFF